MKPKDFTNQKHQGVGDTEIEWKPDRDDVQKAIQVFKNAYETIEATEGGG